MQRSFTIVTGDDWMGIYLEGILVVQGHTPTASRSLEDLLMDVFDIDFESREADQVWLQDRGNLPKKLSDVEEA